MEFDPALRNVASFFTSEEASDARLFEVERRQTEGFGERRMADFTTGRHCARMAMRQFGLFDRAIPIGEGRQPVWPEGICGSISHSKGLSGAIVSSREHHLSLGLDVERRLSVDEKLWDHLFTGTDIALLRSLGPDAREWATLLFSLKESFYKLQYPLSGRFLDFPEVSLMRFEDGFRAVWEEDLSLPETLKRHRLGHRFTEGHVVTFAILENVEPVSPVSGMR